MYNAEFNTKSGVLTVWRNNNRNVTMREVSELGDNAVILKDTTPPQEHLHTIGVQFAGAAYMKFDDIVNSCAYHFGGDAGMPSNALLQIPEFKAKHGERYGNTSTL